MSGMSIQKNDSGAVNALLISLIFSVILLFSAVGFGAWAYSSQQDYKKNSDEKSAKAVAIAVKKTQTEKDNEFLEREKQPLRDYKGLAGLGSISFKYPKTWSATSKDSDSELSLIMHPLIVSTNDKSLYALRVEVINQSYDNLIKQQDANVKKGVVSARPYALPKLPNVVGIRFDGAVSKDKNGSVILLPMRDKTLRISTESQEFKPDFDKIILPEFSYSP
jgi:hypothetical protein